MNPTQAERYRRIQTFSIDAGDETLTFAHRLARENGWSLTYTRRVIEEYKKFAFLAVAGEHAVTPSEEVDQAWHLHLTYTRSYWEHFCPQALGRPLHHDPTRGGPDEHRKFVAQYNRTLETYRRVFGEEPPADIWPDAGKRFAADVRRQWVNTSNHWVVPKKLILRSVLLGTVAAGLLSLIVGCTPALFAANNRGGAGGLCFALVFVAIFVVAIILADWKRGGGSRGSDGSAGCGCDGGGCGGGGCGGGGCGGGGCGGGGE
jgi:hypothetical protein